MPNQPLQRQHQPSQLIGEVNETEGFTRKNKDGREAERRLANRRLRPLGHLTATGMLSIYDVSVYETGVVPIIVTESGPVDGSEWTANCRAFAV